MFFATGGQYLNADDFFKTKALTVCKSKLAKMEKKKSVRLKHIETDREAKSVKALDVLVSHANEEKFLIPECELTCKWKACKIPSSNNKEQHIAVHLKMSRLPTPEPWTEEEGALLKTLKTDNVDLKDTALGVAAKQRATAVAHDMEKLDDKTWNKLLKSLAECNSNVNAPRPPDPNNTAGIVWLVLMCLR